MRKIVFGIFFLTALVAIRAEAFWPFEKIWNNSAEEYRVFLNDNGFETVVFTRSQTVGEFLAEHNISLGEDDYFFPPKENKLSWGMAVMIKRALPVTIKADQQEVSLKTFRRTVAEALDEAGVTVSHLDKVTPQKNSSLEKNMEIVITRINVEDITEEEPIEFEVIEKDDPKLKWKKTRVDQDGKSGTKEVSYRITYTNGKQSKKEKLSSKVVEKPVNKIVAVGTKIEVGKVTRGGATWYAYTNTMACASLDHPKGTWLRVTNTTNGKQVIVQVNDSGPYGKGRIIDLDKKAFAKIADLGAGVVNVKVEEILE